MSGIAQRIATLSNGAVLTILVGSALVTGALSLLLSRGFASTAEWLGNALLNFSTEMLGAFLTFILIDLVIGGRERQESEWRDDRRRLRTRLIKRLRSPDPQLTVDAASELRAMGWLQGGSLEGAYLSHSNLSGVDMSHANLQGARFHKAKLFGTALHDADLEGTTLRVSQLANAASLRGATMPDGRPFDGRLRLEGDLAAAEEMNIAVSDIDEMADYYAVPAHVYRRGQSWADARLASIKSEVMATTRKSWWDK